MQLISRLLMLLADCYFEYSLLYFIHILLISAHLIHVPTFYIYSKSCLSTNFILASNQYF